MRKALALLLSLLTGVAAAQVVNLGPGSQTGSGSVVAVWSASTRSTGSNNAQVVTTNTGNFTLQAGNAVTFVPGITNTGTVTVNVDGQGAVTVNANGTPAPSSALVIGVSATLIYNGSTFDLASASSPSVSGGLSAANNLSDLTSPWRARANICGDRTITTGASDTATTADCIVRWKSSTLSAKSETIPACSSGNDGFEIDILDEAGDASTYNITVSPASGTILSTNGYVIPVGLGSVTLHCDGANTNYTVL